ncbi:MAG: hypothetical protein IJ735_07120 [Clostridia bacterium]|nr:hypothetical protein [Clostridia bacterium]
MKKSVEAQRYILQAKRRLSEFDYDANPKDETRLYINNKKLSSDQIFVMRHIIEEIAASEDLVFDALGRLITDPTEFLRLTEAEKVKYMLDLSKVYSYLKSKII